jgi:hypothetical protein
MKVAPLRKWRESERIAMPGGIYTAGMTTFPALRPDRRLAGLGMTVLVHALFILGWQAARQLPPRQVDVSWVSLRWIPPRWIPPRAAPALPAAQPAQIKPESNPAELPRERRTAGVAADRVRTPAVMPETPAEPAPAVQAEPAAPDVSAQEMLERARRDAGAVDRALRKESRPLIVAPRDSPQIRLRKGIETAADLAPNGWYEAPKIKELVNNTGDGARRARVITGNGTYCITDRATTTNVEMIEMHGKMRKTNCSDNEAPSNPQEWRTARDP